MPARAIGAKTVILPEVGAAYSIMLPNSDSPFQWHMRLHYGDGKTSTVRTPRGWHRLRHKLPDCHLIETVFPDHEGTAVWTRPDLARATLAKSMREQHGIRTVAEFDDNYLSDPKFNYFMRVNRMDATARLDHMKSVASMDAIIVSTEWLRDHYRKLLFAEVKTCPPIYVCGNHVELDRWPERIPSEDGRLRVGYMGSSSHIWDIKLAFPSLKWAADQGHRVILIGHDPGWRRFFDYEHIPWTLPEDYRRQGLPLDVGLAPVLWNEHTAGKSDIKAVEYWMSGAAVIASNNPIYNRTVRHEENGLLATSREELWWATQRMCSDAGLRRETVAAGQEYVRAERDIKKHTGEWLEAIRGD